MTQNETNPTSPQLTAKQLMDKLVPIFIEMEDLESQVKNLKDDIADDVDFSGVVAIAKAKVKGKVGKLEEKAQATLDMIEELI
jgi:hypothetical protein